MFCHWDKCGNLEKIEACNARVASFFRGLVWLLRKGGDLNEILVIDSYYLAIESVDRFAMFGG